MKNDGVICHGCHVFDAVKEMLEHDNRIMKPGVPFMLEQLNDTFTRDEYNVIERAQCPNAA